MMIRGIMGLPEVIMTEAFLEPETRKCIFIVWTLVC